VLFFPAIYVLFLSLGWLTSVVDIPILYPWIYLYIYNVPYCWNTVPCSSMFHCNTDYTMFHYYLILKVVLVNLQAGARVLPDDRLQLLRLRKQSRSKDESWTSTTPIPSSYTSGSLGFPFRSTAMRLKWGEPLQTAAGILGVGFLTCFFFPQNRFSSSWIRVRNSLNGLEPCNIYWRV